jgi:hypothetical protein
LIYQKYLSNQIPWLRKVPIKVEESQKGSKAWEIRDSGLNRMTEYWDAWWRSLPKIRGAYLGRNCIGNWCIVCKSPIYNEMENDAKRAPSIEMSHIWNMNAMQDDPAKYLAHQLHSMRISRSYVTVQKQVQLGLTYEMNVIKTWNIAARKVCGSR